MGKQAQADLEKLRVSFKETRADSKAKETMLRKLANRMEEDEPSKLELEAARCEVKRLTDELQDVHEQLEQVRGQDRASGGVEEARAQSRQEVESVKEELE